MADVHIDPFDDDNKTDSHPDGAGEIIPLNPVAGAMEGSTCGPD